MRSYLVGFVAVSTHRLSRGVLRRSGTVHAGFEEIALVVQRDLLRLFLLLELGVAGREFFLVAGPAFLGRIQPLAGPDARFRLARAVGLREGLLPCRGLALRSLR